MKKIISLGLMCAMLLTSATTFTVNAESAEEKLKTNQAKQQEIDGKIDTLNEKLSQVEEKITSANEKIEKINEDSIQLEDEIEKLEKDISANEEALGERLKIINNNYTLGYLKVILSSDSISGFLNNIFIVQEVVQQDKDMLQQLEVDKKEIQIKKEKLDKNKEEVKVIKEELEKNKESLDSDKSELKSLKDELEKEEDELEVKLQQLAAQNSASSNGGTGSSSVISNGSWPVPGYSRVSSPFGYRIHPVLGYSKLHTGIDIPAPTGTPTVAVESGTVIFSGTQGSYGKTVMIRHDNGNVSLYAHNSELLVSVGQTVQKGQSVTKVGSTGRSTGPHLHFEIRVNGVAQNPLNYL